MTRATFSAPRRWRSVSLPQIANISTVQSFIKSDLHGANFYKILRDFIVGEGILVNSQKVLSLVKF